MSKTKNAIVMNGMRGKQLDPKVIRTHGHCIDEGIGMTVCIEMYILFNWLPNAEFFFALSTNI